MCGSLEEGWDFLSSNENEVCRCLPGSAYVEDEAGVHRNAEEKTATDVAPWRPYRAGLGPRESKIGAAREPIVVAIIEIVMVAGETELQLNQTIEHQHRQTFLLSQSATPSTIDWDYL